VKFRIGLENFKDVFAHVGLYKVMTSNSLSFTVVEINKNSSLTQPQWKCLCHRWSREQLQPGSFLEEKEPGNEVGAKLQCVTLCGLASVSFDKTNNNTCILL